MNLLIFIFYFSFAYCLNDVEEDVNLDTVRLFLLICFVFLIDFFLREQIELLNKYGMPTEVHYVTTTDCYILQLHRIPQSKTGGKRKTPVILQHGLLGSSADWVLLGPKKAMGT